MKLELWAFKYLIVTATFCLLIIPSQEGRKTFKSTHLRSGHAHDATPPKLFAIKKDMFNLSNDEYYNPRQVASSSLLGFESTVVQHSIPALDLHLSWFTPHLSSAVLRHFHRPQLRIRCSSRETSTGFYTISDLRKHSLKKAKVLCVCVCPCDCADQYKQLYNFL